MMFDGIPRMGHGSIMEIAKRWEISPFFGEIVERRF
jgi:hypothetical protein